MSKSTRKIKCLGNSVETNEYYFHPITLALFRNKGEKKICPSEFHYVNGKPYHSTPNDSVKLSNMDIQRFMALPYLNLNIEQMLSIYHIDSIDDIVKWIDNMIVEKKQFNTINRILNIWIRYNFTMLQTNNRILLSIYTKLNKEFYNNEQIDIMKGINKWFETKIESDFSLDLAHHLFDSK